MPRGYPDYFGQQMFPKYGALKSISDYHSSSGSGEKTLVNINGKGIVFGGRIWVLSSDARNYDIIRMYIDGESSFSMAMSHMNLYDVDYNSQLPVFLIYYDELNPRYEIGIRSGITFDSNFKLTYYQSNPTAFSIFYDFYYTLIQ